MTSFGLIGYPLSHSFSGRYFRRKFADLGLTDHRYELFPLTRIEDLPALLREHPHLRGLNVTIPYKEAVLPYLTDLSPEARAVGAVNTILLSGDRRKGFNTDVTGFRQSLLEFLPEQREGRWEALVLGTGGAAKAVAYVLGRLGMPFRLVSRSSGRGDLTYESLRPADVRAARLLINTTPLGMHPQADSRPPLPYDSLGPGHFLFDLVYNPEKTLFLKEGERRQARIQNGLRMLHLQAEAAWDIWTRPPVHPPD